MKGKLSVFKRKLGKLNCEKTLTFAAKVKSWFHQEYNYLISKVTSICICVLSYNHQCCYRNWDCIAKKRNLTMLTRESGPVVRTS